MLNKNYLKDKLKSGDKALGTWNIVNSSMLVDIIASTGLNFIVIDAEHGSISYETAQTFVSICQSHNVSPIMRLGEVNESLILRALDIGVHGVQIPNIQTVDDAKLLVRYAKYPPIGNRGLSPYTKAGLYDVKNAARLVETANSNTILIANIEDETGLKNIESIVKVDGLDVVFIGLFDLSKSLGIPGEVRHERVLSKLEWAVDIVHKFGKKIGSIATTPEMLTLLKSKGVDYITYSVDSGVVKESYQSIVKKFEEDL